MVGDAYRGTVVALVATSTEGHVMAVHRAGAGDGVGEVGGVAAVIIVQTQRLGSVDIAVAAKHLDILVY